MAVCRPAAGTGCNRRPRRRSPRARGNRPAARLDDAGWAATAPACGRCAPRLGQPAGPCPSARRPAGPAAGPPTWPQGALAELAHHGAPAARPCRRSSGCCQLATSWLLHFHVASLTSTTCCPSASCTTSFTSRPAGPGSRVDRFDGQDVAARRQQLGHVEPLGLAPGVGVGSLSPTPRAVDVEREQVVGRDDQLGRGDLRLVGQRHRPRGRRRCRRDSPSSSSPEPTGTRSISPRRNSKARQAKALAGMSRASKSWPLRTAFCMDSLILWCSRLGVHSTTRSLASATIRVAVPACCAAPLLPTCAVAPRVLG